LIVALSAGAMFMQSNSMAESHCGVIVRSPAQLSSVQRRLLPSGIKNARKAQFIREAFNSLLDCRVKEEPHFACLAVTVTHRNPIQSWTGASSNFKFQFQILLSPSSSQKYRSF
jgi:hypothetical protein